MAWKDLGSVDPFFASNSFSSSPFQQGGSGSSPWFGTAGQVQEPQFQDSSLSPLFPSTPSPAPQAVDAENPLSTGKPPAWKNPGVVEAAPMGSSVSVAQPVEQAKKTPKWSDVISRVLGSFSSGMAGDKGGMTSDVRAKKNVRSARGEGQALLEELRREGPKQYDYRAEYGGQHAFGPMAQTLEKGGPMGAAMVGRDPQTGMRYLKGPEMVKGLMAALAEQQRQIDELRVSHPARPQYADEYAPVGRPKPGEPGPNEFYGAIPSPALLQEEFGGAVPSKGLLMQMAMERHDRSAVPPAPKGEPARWNWDRQEWEVLPRQLKSAKR